MVFSFSSFFRESLASRRTLRTATLASSVYLRATLTSSLRRSSVSGGMLMRMMRPSLTGVRPRSDLRMAFSTTEMPPLSQGWMVMVRLSGTATEAIWEMGVGVP